MGREPVRGKDTAMLPDLTRRTEAEVERPPRARSSDRGAAVLHHRQEHGVIGDRGEGHALVAAGAGADPGVEHEVAVLDPAAAEAAPGEEPALHLDPVRAELHL